MTWVDEERDAYLLGLMRCLLGVLLCIQVWQRTEEFVDGGYFGAYFHLPLLVPEALVPSQRTYGVLLGMEGAGALLAVVGWFGREGLFVGSSVGLWLLLCDRLQFHNNRFALLLVCFLCAFCPSDRSFLLYRGRAHALPLAKRLAPTLPRRLIQFQISLLYLASGGGKLLDPDWRGGQTMLRLVQANLAQVASHGVTLPHRFVELVSSPLVGSFGAKAVICLELSLAVTLWFPRTRGAALWSGALFHIFIQASAAVELFSFLMGVAYMAYVTPEIRERTLLVDLRTRSGRAARALVRALDWLARFRVEELSPVGAGEPSVIVVGRSGKRSSGRSVPAALARALPLAFLLWPVLAIFADKSSALRVRAPSADSLAGRG